MCQCNSGSDQYSNVGLSYADCILSIPDDLESAARIDGGKYNTGIDDGLCCLLCLSHSLL